MLEALRSGKGDPTGRLFRTIDQGLIPVYPSLKQAASRAVILGGSADDFGHEEAL